MMRAAIVGCGTISGAHIRALQEIENVEICGVCDRDRDSANRAAQMAEGARAYADLEALLERERPDAVHVLTPPATHAALSIRAMKAGCHVLVEKPMTLSIEEADQMIAAAQEHEVQLSTNHNVLFKPSVMQARQLVASGAIGQVIYVESYYGLAGEATGYSDITGQTHWAWRLPGGIFTNFWPHLISVQLAFLPQGASVAGVALGTPGGVDGLATEATVLLQAEGASGTMILSMRAKPQVKFADIYGTKGIIHADMVREICTVHQDRRLPRILGRTLFSLEDSFQTASGTVSSVAKVVLGRIKSTPGLRILVRDFYASIQQGQPPPVTGQDGRRMVEVMEQIWSSSRDSGLSLAPQPRTRDLQAPQSPTVRAIRNGRKMTGRVLVTGAAGFLGYHVVTALAACGADVVGLVRDKNRVSDALSSQAQLVSGDLRDPDSIEAAMRGVDTVYHCAALTANNAPWEAHYQVNIAGTQTVFQKALNAGVRRVVHASSVIVYGLDRSQVDERIRESTPYASNPDKWAFYMRSKIEADRLAFKYWYESQLPVTVLRLGILYGPGGRRSIGGGLVQLGPFRLNVGTGRNRLPYLYVSNAVDCFLLAAAAPVAIGQAYNVVDEPQVRVRDVILGSSRVLGEPVKLVPVPSWLLSTTARFIESKQSRIPPKLSRYVVASACRDFYYDTSKARHELGWQSAVSLEEGLRRTLGDSFG